MCTFDVLQENKENLFLDQFLKLYEVLDIKWKQVIFLYCYYNYSC